MSHQQSQPTRGGMSHEPTVNKYFNVLYINTYITLQDISQSVLSYENNLNRLSVCLYWVYIYILYCSTMARRIFKFICVPLKFSVQGQFCIDLHTWFFFVILHIVFSALISYCDLTSIKVEAEKCAVKIKTYQYCSLLRSYFALVTTFAERKLRIG